MRHVRTNFITYICKLEMSLCVHKFSERTGERRETRDEPPDPVYWAGNGAQ